MRKPIEEFLSECSEWHALWLGFYSSFFKIRREKLPEYLKEDIRREYHYYTFGFFIGRLVQALLVLMGVRLWT
jgi:hypothetical protein